MTAVTKYTSPELVGYLCRRHDGRIAVCRREDTAKKLACTGVLRINAADHCRLGSMDSNTVIDFTERDQSYQQLQAVLVQIEYTEDGYPVNVVPRETVDAK